MIVCVYQLKLQGEKSGRKGHLSVATEVMTDLFPGHIAIPISTFPVAHF